MKKISKLFPTPLLTSSTALGCFFFLTLSFYINNNVTLQRKYADIYPGQIGFDSGTRWYVSTQ